MQNVSLLMGLSLGLATLSVLNLSAAGVNSPSSMQVFWDVDDPCRLLSKWLTINWASLLISSKLSPERGFQQGSSPSEGPLLWLSFRRASTPTAMHLSLCRIGPTKTSSSSSPFELAGESEMSKSNFSSATDTKSCSSRAAII